MAASCEPMWGSQKQRSLDAMEFRIADAFVDSFARLNGQERKAAKLAAVDAALQAGRQPSRLEGCS